MSQSTIVLLSQELMFNTVARFLETAKTEVLAVLSSYTLILTTDMEIFQTRKQEARRRGVKLRYITEITKENLPYCKRQMDMVDGLRHLYGIKGNFIVNDTEFMASPDISEEKPLTEGIYSNMSEVVKQERYVFETLWNHAIPAEVRIGQLEEGRDNATRPQKVIDRFYVCAECRSVFIYRDDAHEHQRITGHQKIREFPILD